MANCTKCGNPIKQGEKFCASCGTPVKQATAVKSGTAKPATAKKASAVTTVGSATMGKIAVITVIAACGVTVIFFFFTFFAVSFAGSGASVNGMQAAVSGGSGNSGTGGANPALLLVWLFAIAMIVALCVPIVRQKLDSVQLPAINVPVIGGMGIFAYLAIVIGFIGLIVLIAAYSSTIGYAKRVSGYDYLSILGSTIKFHTGIGFKVTVLAQLVLLGIPFADKYFLSKRG